MVQRSKAIFPALRQVAMRMTFPSAAEYRGNMEKYARELPFVLDDCRRLQASDHNSYRDSSGLWLCLFVMVHM